MSVWVQDGYDVPDATRRVAHAAFPKGCLAIRLRDELGELFRDKDFVGLFGVRGRPAVSPARLAMVSILQFVEGLTDRQAADAVRGRLDWKYALGLPLDDCGFDASVLTEFRGRLLSEQEPQRLLRLLLDRLQENGFLSSGGRQRTDATSVVMAVRDLNRVELVVETLRAALEVIAAAAPDWLLEHGQSSWWQRYSQRASDYRLPRGEQARADYAVEVGRDGYRLLRALHCEPELSWLAELHQVDVLRMVWVQQYHLDDVTVVWRSKEDGLPPGVRLILSPYDLDARHGFKHGQKWLGYKAHFTEVCDPDRPHVIVHVATSHAATADIEALPGIQADLAEAGLLPNTQFVDAGYVSVDGVLDAKDRHGIELIGPLPPDSGWQARDADAFDISRFAIDFTARRVTCPNGKTSISWGNSNSRSGLPIVKVGFGRRNCTPCPDRPLCTRSSVNARFLTFRAERQFHAQQQIRAEQATEQWHQRYAIRAGVEATMAQASARSDVHRTRYKGAAKTELQHIFTACALNLIRIHRWITGTTLQKAWTSRIAMIAAATAT